MRFDEIKEALGDSPRHDLGEVLGMQYQCSLATEKRVDELQQQLEGYLDRGKVASDSLGQFSERLTELYQRLQKIEAIVVDHVKHGEADDGRGQELQGIHHLLERRAREIIGLRERVGAVECGIAEVSTRLDEAVVIPAPEPTAEDHAFADGLVRERIKDCGAIWDCDWRLTIRTGGLIAAVCRKCDNEEDAGMLLIGLTERCQRGGDKSAPTPAPESATQRVLKICEWHNSGYCPACAGHIPIAGPKEESVKYGHFPDCDWAAAKREQGEG